MTGDTRLAADIILTEEQKTELGKSFWDAIPPAIQNLVTDELYSRLPDAIRKPVQVYRAIKYRIESAGTYSEIERLAVLFNPPASSTMAGAIKSGTWCAMPGGYCARAFPSGYTAARLQIFVPDGAGTVRFSLGDFILVPADTGRQRLGLRAVGSGSDDGPFPPPPEKNGDIEIVFKEGERLSNPDVIAALKKLAELLGADRVRVSDGDRSFEVYKKIKGNAATYEDYLKNYHGEGHGHIAADSQFYKDGKMIPHTEVADAAGQVKDIGGIGLYDTHTHIDLRERLPGDIPTRWDKRGKK